ncbi:hypothetical protein PoB_003812600 [Plakobranchus ocellatus]|uniref:Uncharacterized protein n=1 Tax=Plakobranchus ocellatus TaxID=259542 RepID=A0AAV4AKB5_9GAST|nr:hypothetical protein PoB_003812600 [Plakobranchus ocellatus]
MSFCERTGLAASPVQDLWPCECDSNRTAMCKHCCLDRAILDSTCQVMGGSFKDGTACLRGKCFHGRCLDRKDIRKDLSPLQPASIFGRVRVDQDHTLDGTFITAQSWPLLLEAQLVLLILL